MPGAIPTKKETREKWNSTPPLPPDKSDCKLGKMGADDDMEETKEHHHQHHHHHGGHGHGHGHGEESGGGLGESSHTEVNRKAWNEVATTMYKSKWVKTMLNQVHGFLLANLSWIGVDFLDPAASFEGGKVDANARSIRVLDFACGPGSMTNIFAGLATEFVGLDISENMVEAYNARFSLESGPAPYTVEGEPSTTSINAHASVCDFLNPAGPTPAWLESESKYFDFDLIVVGFAFHHFDDVNLAATRLVQRLKPGGVLLILEVAEYMGDMHKEEEGERDMLVRQSIKHYGFGDGAIEAVFEKAGLVEVGAMPMEDLVEMKKGPDADDRPGWWKKVFAARGRKPI